MVLKQKQSKIKLFFEIQQIKYFIIFLSIAFLLYLPLILGKYLFFILGKMGIKEALEEPLGKTEMYINGVIILFFVLIAICVIGIIFCILKELAIQILIAIEKVKLITPYSKLPLTIEEVEDNKLDLHKYLELILKSSTYNMSKYKINSFYSGDVLTEEVYNELIKVLLEHFYDDLFSENNKELLPLLKRYDDNVLADDLICFIDDYNKSTKKNCYRDPLFIESNNKYVYYESFDKDDDYSFKICKKENEFTFEEY